MNRIDGNGLLLCDMQANLFEKSLSLSCGSEIFIRRFMNSRIAVDFDSSSVLNDTITCQDIINSIAQEYGEFSYGNIKYSNNELYWIGYLYRYFSYMYQLSSKQVYKIIKPKELRILYEPYHTMSVPTAIDRILESKEIDIGKDSYTSMALKILRKANYNVETYDMSLFDASFESIKDGTKTIEFRLNDEKRKKLKAGDVIVFSKINSKEKLTVKVVKTHRYKSIKSLCSGLDKEASWSKAKKEDITSDILNSYPENEINKYGILAIEIKPVRYNHNSIPTY